MVREVISKGIPRLEHPRVMGTIFLIDLVMEHRRFTLPALAEHQGQGVLRFISAIAVMELQTLDFIPSSFSAL